MSDGVNFPHPQYLTMDHIGPLLPAGKPLRQNTLVNVVPACWKCNHSKDDKPVFQWLAQKNITPSPQLLPILHHALELHHLPKTG